MSCTNWSYPCRVCTAGPFSNPGWSGYSPTTAAKIVLPPPPGCYNWSTAAVVTPVAGGPRWLACEAMGSRDHSSHSQPAAVVGPGAFGAAIVGPGPAMALLDILGPTVASTKLCSLMVFPCAHERIIKWAGKPVSYYRQPKNKRA